MAATRSGRQTTRRSAAGRPDTAASSLHRRARQLAFAVAAGLFCSGFPAETGRATILPEGNWSFAEAAASQGVPAARYRDSELFSALTFDKTTRQWRLLLLSGHDWSRVTRLRLSAVYDEDPARNRPHRVETLELEPSTVSTAQSGLKEILRGTYASQAIQLTLPRTFIVHLQGADRLTLEAGAFRHVIAMNGSAKAIAQIYAALGEARGGEGKTITEIVSQPAQASAPAPQVTNAASGAHATAVVNAVAEIHAAFAFCGRLRSAVKLEAHGECIVAYVAAMEQGFESEPQLLKVEKQKIAAGIVEDVPVFLRAKYPPLSIASACVKGTEPGSAKSYHACLESAESFYFTSVQANFRRTYEAIWPELLAQDLDGSIIAVFYDAVSAPVPGPNPSSGLAAPDAAPQKPQPVLIMPLGEE